MIIKIILGLLLGLFLLLIYSCCVVASKADQYMEDYNNENKFIK